MNKNKHKWHWVMVFFWAYSTITIGFFTLFVFLNPLSNKPPKPVTAQSKQVMEIVVTPIIIFLVAAGYKNFKD